MTAHKVVRATSMEDAEQKLEEASGEARRTGRPVWMEVEGCPSRIYLAAKAVDDGGAQLSGYRAPQPRRLADREGIALYRMPLPKRKTQGLAQHARVNGIRAGTINWTTRRHGPAWEGEAEAWSAERVHALERVEADGSRGWRQLRERYGREINEPYEPKTATLVAHAEEMPGAITRITARPREQLGREDAIVAVHRAPEVNGASYAWLMRQPGRNIHERAQRGVRCSIRTPKWDTLENRAVLDYARRTVLEIGRLAQPNPVLERWRRLCRRTCESLRALGVGPLEPSAKANQVLRLNPDYRRTWEARKKLLNRSEQTEQLWCWQGETWNELALCLFQAAMADAGREWRPVARGPIRMRRDQVQGRWIVTSQQTAAIWANLEKQRILRAAGGGIRVPGNEWLKACRIRTERMDGAQSESREVAIYAEPPADTALDRETGRVGIRRGKEGIEWIEVRPREDMRGVMDKLQESVAWSAR